MNPALCAERTVKPEFNTALLFEALVDMAGFLHFCGQQARLYVFGDAAMMLAHGSPRTIHEVSAVVEHGHCAALDAARFVAMRRQWPATWLNGSTTTHIPRPQHRIGRRILDHPALDVRAATNEEMLAMKAQRAKPVDRKDVELLLSAGLYSSLAQLEGTVRAVFSDKPLGARQREWLTVILDDLQHSRTRHCQPL